MVTTSFTLRKTSVGGGSALQQPSSVDTGLRSDQYINLSNVVTYENTFSVNVISVNSVKISWSLDTPLESAPTSPAPIGLLVVASVTGEPITIQDGVVVGSLVTSTTTSNFIMDIARSTPGRWVYYSLFSKFSDGAGTPTYWYEKTATAAIQIIGLSNMLENMWKKIPEYYRSLDVTDADNSLLKFIELFSWEAEKTRTLISSINYSSDPTLANSESIAQLAKQLGLETTIEAIGTTKVRALLQNMGSLRRRKGTIESISQYISALTGCPIHYQKVSTTHTFYVHTQKINYIPDGNFNQAVASTTTSVGANRVTNFTSSTWGVYCYAGTSAATFPTVTPNGSGITITAPAGATGNTTVLVYSRIPFMYDGLESINTAFKVDNAGATVSYNFNSTVGSGVTFNNLQLMTAAKKTSLESSASTGTLPSSLFYDTWNTSPHYLPVNNLDNSEWRVTIPANAAANTSVHPVLSFTLAPSASITLKDFIVSPSSVYSYFDGDTREGGLIPQLSGYGVGTSDYRWQGTSKASFSLYTNDYQRTVAVVTDIVGSALMPVTMLSSYALVWNYYLT